MRTRMRDNFLYRMRLWRKVEGLERRTREYHYYYCNWWCWLTDQRLCWKGK